MRARDDTKRRAGGSIARAGLVAEALPSEEERRARGHATDGVAVGGRQAPLGVPDLATEGGREPHESDGFLGAAAVGTGDAGDRERELALARARRAERHRLGHLAADRAVRAQELPR